MTPRKLPDLSKKQWLGFGFVYLAGLGWLFDLIIPFTRLHHKPTYFAATLGVAEVCFLLGITLLGRAYYRQIKAKFFDHLRSQIRDKE